MVRFCHPACPLSARQADSSERVLQPQPQPPRACFSLALALALSLVWSCSAGLPCRRPAASETRCPPARARAAMSTIDSLLNHESAVPATPATRPNAAAALTALATLGHGQQFVPAPARELPSPTTPSSAPRRSTNIGSLHAPVDPDLPLDPPQAHSPTLEHYHHGSQSPEEQKRRQSLMSRSSPAPVLAPMQHLASALHDQIQDELAQSQAHESEPEPLIKTEPSGTPREHTPGTAQRERQGSTTADSVDADTRKALEIAKQSDLGLRAKRTGSVAENLALPIDAKPAPAASKKRPAPSSTSAAKKKGTAKALKPSKKRKLDTDDPSAARSVTPTGRSKSAPGKSSKKASPAGTPGLESSPAPDNSSQVNPSDDEADSSEDHNLYCICRKPDNHKWMIGCDGGCDDWFHGDCVNLRQADEGLVDKFICPNCEENGRGNTTWKPMCRRDGCRKPARLGKDARSKYCSEDCGVLFFSEQLERTAGAGVNGTKDKSRKKKRTSDVEPGDEEEEPTPLGGVLRAKDLKALVDASPNIQAFKNLGSGVLSPPQTASPTRATFGNQNLNLTAAETERLTALYKEKSQLKDRLEVLKDREKFVSMAKEQATRVAEREKMKLKEFCAYDSRLSWSDAEFLLWRNSKHGCAAFQFSTLSPTPEQVSSMPAAAANGADAMVADVNDDDAKESVCLKKRCNKHPQWQKLNLQDARFEELEVFEAIRECDKEERSVRERARRRGAKDGLARELTAADGSKEVRNREGWVELVTS